MIQGMSWYTSSLFETLTASSIIGALLYVIYAYSGYYQVFYVLSEVLHPKRLSQNRHFSRSAW